MRLLYILTLATVSALFSPIVTSAKTTLQVPFTSQAPFGDWRQPWQDACEESVITMVDGFYNKYTLPPNRAKKEILKALDVKEQYFGVSEDEDADQMVRHINQFYSWEAYVVDAPSIDLIKREIDQGRPVILPVYGKALKNPHFRNNGPNYHTLVISGYDDVTQEFITQEPGTKYGKNYRYGYAQLMDAMHDFVEGGKMETGRKVAIFTRKNPTTSAQLDGDQDGLTKEQEFRLGTNVANPDTDGDGFSDYIEIRYGYSPLTNESLIPSGSLVKMASDPKVYLIKNGLRHHILTEDAFFRHNWKWYQVQDVGKTFLEKFPQGSPIL